MRTAPQKATRAGLVWAYLVVSSDQQVETLAFQRQWANRTALENGWFLADVFEAVSSGRDGLRELLETLLTKLRATAFTDRPERVLMTRLDRLGRGTALGPLAAFAEITRLGVKIHTRQDGDYRLARASDSILPMMRIITAAIENESRIDKAVSTYDRKRRDGLVASNRRPYGLRLESGQDVKDGDRAAMVSKAFELAANGYGLYAIGKRLSLIAPPQEFRNGRVHIVNWSADRVRKLLGNESYRGTVVDEPTWSRVLAMRSGNETERCVTKNPYPLSGALTCDCGRRLIGSIRGSQRQRVYRCTSRATHQRVITHSAPSIEGLFSRLITDLSASPELIARYAADAETADQSVMLESALRRACAAVATAEKEKNRIWDLNESGKLRDEDLQARLNTVQARIHEAESEIFTLQRQLEASEHVKRDREEAATVLNRAAKLWSVASVEDQKTIAKAVARAIGGLTVSEDGLLQARPPANRNMYIRARGD